jgi:flagellar biosynthesis GTPase FlhF
MLFVASGCNGCDSDKPEMYHANDAQAAEAPKKKELVSPKLQVEDEVTQKKALAEMRARWVDVNDTTDKDIEVRKPVEHQTQLQRLHQWVQSSLADGVFHSVDVEYNEVRMDPAIWRLLPNIETKQMIVGNLRQYFDLKGSTGRVTIRSKYSDEKLASYSVWTGIKIYR